MQDTGSFRRRQNIQHLLEAVDRVGGYTDKKEILQTTAIKMVYLLGAETSLVSVWDSENQQIVPEAFHTSGDWKLPGSWYQPKNVAFHPLFQRVQSLGRSAQFNTGGMSLPLKTLKAMEEARVQSWVAFPLLGSDQSILGIVDVLDSREPRLFREEDVALGEMLAKLSSAAYQRALLFERSEKYGRQLNALVEMISSFANTQATSSAHESLAMIAKIFADLSRASYCAVSFYEPESGKLEPISFYGVNSSKPTGWCQEPRELAGYPLEAAGLFEQKIVHLREEIQEGVTSRKDFFTEKGIRSVIMVPMFMEGQLSGIVELMDVQGVENLTADDLTLFRVLGEHVIQAIHHARVREFQLLEHRFAETLIEATRTMNSSLNLNEVLDRILEQIIAFTNGKSANVMLLEKDVARVVRSIGYEGVMLTGENQPSLSFPLSTPNLKEMFKTKKSVLIGVTAEHPDWIVVPGAEWIRSYIGAPLIVENEVIGFLNMDADRPHFFTEQMIEPVEAFASIAAGVLRNAQRYKSVQERASELEIVRRAALSLTASLDLKDVLNAILKQSLELFSGPRDGHIFLYQGELLHFGAARRGDGTEGEIWAEPRKEGLTYTVARTGTPIIVDDMRQHPLFQNAPDEWRGSIIGLPLKYGGDVVGVMNIAHEKVNQFKDPQIRILNLLADQAAIAIVNARLHHFVEELSRTDPLTGLHNRRAFNARLAEEALRAERYGRPFSLALLDLNGFKYYNDTYGHITGDKLLIRIGQCLLENIRGTDFLARYGGDEFALIMPETTHAEAVELTARLQQVLSDCDLGLEESNTKKVSVSVGIAQFLETTTDPEKLVVAADRALYQEKNDWQEKGERH